MRRGKCYQLLGDYEEAKKDIDSCLFYEPTNGEARGVLKKITEVIESKMFAQTLEKANNQLRDAQSKTG